MARPALTRPLPSRPTAPGQHTPARARDLTQHRERVTPQYVPVS